MTTKKSDGIQEVFSTLNRKFEEEETQRRAARLNMPYFELAGFPIDQNALELVSKDEAQNIRAIPFFRDISTVKVGTADPEAPGLKKLLERLVKDKYEVELYLVSKSGLTQSLVQYRKVLFAPSVTRPTPHVNTGSEVVDKLGNLTRDRFDPAATSATDLINLIIGAAITINASDIHLEPEKDSLKIRFRIDGMLQEMVSLPKSLLAPLMSRIKLASNLKLNVTATPQDGRFTVMAKDKPVDLRVSVLPSAHGESVVIRLLGMGEISLDIKQLGLQEKALKVLAAELAKPNGMILTTGPTGSGKTTTLYSFLNHLNEPGVKIITLEDPVEYELAGITQTPIDHTAGMDFAKGLRSILRQDPDIIMVGEIRDFETAETACQAALTGHVVLSTLHTNDAAGAIPRFLDLGVKAVTLAPALNALMAQRLLRKICPACKEVYHPTTEELARIKLILSQISPKCEVKIPDPLVLYHSKGCKDCHNLGYRGRIGVVEVFAVDEVIEKLIYESASTQDIKKAAVASGMLTMQQDGILKALQGLTDLAEVWRVTEE